MPGSSLSAKLKTIDEKHKTVSRQLRDPSVGESALSYWGSQILEEDDEEAIQERYKTYLHTTIEGYKGRVHELSKRTQSSRMPLSDEDTRLMIEFEEKKQLLQNLRGKYPITTRKSSNLRRSSRRKPDP